jgi:hypothetical protein
MSKATPLKAIKAIEACCEMYRVKFEISYKKPNKGYISPYHGKWKIVVYGEIHSDKDFVKAVGKAVERCLQMNGDFPFEKK